MRLHMREEWLKFAEALHVHEADELQQRDMERVFMSGAFALYIHLMDLVSGGLEEPTEGDLSMMREIDAEFKQFFGKFKHAKH